MKFPKKIHQELYMGKKCTFTHELYRDYGKEKNIGNTEFGVTRTVPVKWSKYELQKNSGWIVGFGFCFNGTIVTEVGLGENCKYFRASKRVNYVRVRETPTGRELKVPINSITV